MKKIIALTDQKNQSLCVFDISDNTLDNPVWSFDIPHRGLADAKLRMSQKYGQVALATCGADGYGCMISYPEGKLLWSTNAAAQNAHSIELLPNGIIAISSTSGNAIRFFDPNDEYSKSYLAEIPFNNAHSILWDDGRQVLWALGHDIICAHNVELKDGNIRTALNKELCFKLPSNGGHEIAIDFTDKNCLFITTHSTVYRFNIQSGEFTDIFKDIDGIDCKHIKGIGNFFDGEIIYIRPDGKFRVWTSDSIHLTKDGCHNVLSSQTGHFYKCRVWTDEYR